MGKLRKGQLFISLCLVSSYMNVKLRYLIRNPPSVIHDTNPNDRTQNENKGKVTRQLTQITKLLPENKAVT